MSNTQTIAKNTGWSSVDQIVNALVAFISSIAIARYLGPSKTGYIVFVSYVAGVVVSLGALGIPATTRKYMAEFIGKGDKATARYIFFRTFAMQICLATVATAGILIWVYRAGDPQYRTAAVLILLSIWPSMVNAIPAQANVATENFAVNIPGSLSGAVVYLTMILMTAKLGWGVDGIGMATLLMRTVDFLVRFFPTIRRVTRWDAGHGLPEGLRDRMISYAWQSVTILLLSLIVWERSEVVLLKLLCQDIRQVAFYSIGFSLGNYLLLSSTVFGSASSATIFAQFGRDRSRLPGLTATAFRYLALTSIPLHAIAAALAVPALLLLYGKPYYGAALVVTIAPLLCLPKAFLSPVQSLLQCTEKQKWVIAATVFAGIVDWSVAAALIPFLGAAGACIGSGVAQITAVGIMWTIAMRGYGVKLPWGLLAKVIVISLAASLSAYFVSLHMAPLWALVCGGSTALAVLMALFYFGRVLEPQDLDRVRIAAGMLPQRIADPVNKFMSVIWSVRL